MSRLTQHLALNERSVRPFSATTPRTSRPRRPRLCGEPQCGCTSWLLSFCAL